MEQLTGMDASFLYLETAETPMHVVGLLLLDAAPSFSFDRLRTVLLDRLHLMPSFRRRLVEVPLHLDRPYWIRDPDFDVDRHLVRVTAGADDHELGRLVGEFASDRLPRDRPLWQLMVVEGLPGDRVAMVAKIHHCTMYGASGADMIAHLLDLDATGRTVEPPSEPFDPEQPPSLVGLAARAAVHQTAAPVRAGRAVVQTGRNLAGVAGSFVRQLRGPGPAAVPFRAPRTAVDGAPTPRREVAFVQVPLAPVQAVKTAVDGKLNDVVLAAVAGALRSYLLARDALPGRPLVASCPMKLGSGVVEQTDRLTALLVPLPVQLADPAERLRAVVEATRGSKELAGALGPETLADVADVMPPPLLLGGARVYAGLRLARLHPPMQNLVVSNVVGPPIPLFLAGAPVRAIYPMGPLLPGTGLNLTVLSNMGNLDVGLMACPDLVEDVWAVADGFATAVQELRSAVVGVGA